MKKIKLLIIVLIFQIKLFAQDVTLNQPNGQITLSTNIYSGNIIIEPLTTVIIPTGVIIKLKSSKYIDIKPSAKLVVNGSIDYDDSDPSVPLILRRFTGIFVRGIATVRSPGIQSIINGGGYPWGNPISNGILIIDGGEIYNSMGAIQSYNGGIVYVNNARFEGYRNNGIIFQKDLPFSLNSLPTLAIIKNSTFVNSNFLDNEYQYGTTAIQAFKFHGISITNCDFHNEIDDLLAGSEALFLGNSGANIDGCRFYDFSISDQGAIKSMHLVASVRGYINIRNCTFNNCKMGIQLGGIEILQIRDNIFKNPLNLEAIGIKLDNSTGFNISGNKFENYGVGANSRSILVLGSSDVGNKINNNNFIDCAYGVRIIDDNRGLQLRCNDFKALTLSNSQNVFSANYNASVPTNKQGLSDQGTLVSTDYLGIYLPGNIFTQLCLSGPSNWPWACDFSIFPNHPVIKYYHHYSTTQYNNTRPMYYQQNFLTPISGIAPIENRGASCVANFGFPEIISRIENANFIKSGIKPINEDEIKQIEYLNYFIETESADVLKILLDSADDAITLNFLLSKNTNQNLLWLAQYYLDEGQYDSSLYFLDQVEVLDENSYYFRNKQFLMILASHFNLGGDLSNLSYDDISYFETIANSYSPIAYRASKLLQYINEGNEELFVSNKAQWTNLHTDPKNEIFPNPCREILQLSINRMGCNFKITDMSGKQILNGIVSKDFTINISDLNAGIYQLLLTNIDGFIVTEKFVKID